MASFVRSYFSSYIRHIWYGIKPDQYLILQCCYNSFSSVVVTRARCPALYIFWSIYNYQIFINLKNVYQPQKSGIIWAVLWIMSQLAKSLTLKQWLKQWTNKQTLQIHVQNCCIKNLCMALTKSQAKVLPQVVKANI